MKLFKQLIAGVVLALCGVAAANAQQYVPMDPGSPGQYAVSWSFDDSATAPHLAGTDFVDVYQFNTLDTQSISATITDQKVGKVAGVSFLGYELFSWADFVYSNGNPTALATIYAAPGASVLSGGSWTLDSGVYGLAVVGTYLVDGASYKGIINGVAPVPEPAEMMMMMAGLLVVVGAVRRRGKSA